jgi:3-hydroxybutyryl-CoA dehydrogenase
MLLARSDDSAERARASVVKTLDRLGTGIDPEHVNVVTEASAIADATFVVEAIIEHHDSKASLLGDLTAVLAPETILATTTSSLSVSALADVSGRPDRFVGLHVFNPVTKMKLVELVFPPAASDDTKARATALCEALEKTAVVVSDIPGFVVNRLLFPYLFSAVTLLEETDMPAADIDTCMKLGAGHPMGPLALLDLVGLDVSKAIGQEIGSPIPPRVEQLIADGALGRKSGRGFHSY